MMETSKIIDILDDRMTSKRGNPIEKRKFLVRFEHGAEEWIPRDELCPKPEVVTSYGFYILTKARLNGGRETNLADRLFEILSLCQRSELDSLRRQFLTIQGLQLPVSKLKSIVDKLKRLVKQSSVSYDELISIRRDILVEKLIEKRREVAMSVRKAQHAINTISDFQKPIKVTNDVDLEVFPTYLTYVNRYVPIIDDVPVACECDSNGCSSSECIHSHEEHSSLKTTSKKNKTTSGLPYDENGRLKDNQVLIYECNSSCKCDASCPRRNVQNGSKVSLEIFRTFNGCGWGVRTLETIPKGTFVCRYAGELMLWDDGNKLECRDYLFDIDINLDQKSGCSVFTVDAYKFGNVSRFINHCCDSNLSIRVVYIDNIHPEKGEIAFFACRDIAANEELTINYKGLVENGGRKCLCVDCTDKFIKAKKKVNGKKS